MDNDDAALTIWTVTLSGGSETRKVAQEVLEKLDFFAAIINSEAVWRESEARTIEKHDWSGELFDLVLLSTSARSLSIPLYLLAPLLAAADEICDEKLLGSIRKSLHFLPSFADSASYDILLELSVVVERIYSDSALTAHIRELPENPLYCLHTVTTNFGVVSPTTESFKLELPHIKITCVELPEEQGDASLYVALQKPSLDTEAADLSMVGRLLARMKLGAGKIVTRISNNADLHFVVLGCLQFLRKRCSAVRRSAASAGHVATPLYSLRVDLGFARILGLPARLQALNTIHGLSAWQSKQNSKGYFLEGSADLAISCDSNELTAMLAAVNSLLFDTKATMPVSLRVTASSENEHGLPSF